MGVFGWVSTTFFTVSHWMFAYKYWVMSFRIEALLKSDISPNLSCQNKTNRVTLTSVFFCSTASTLLFYLICFAADHTDLFEYILFYFMLWMTAFFDGFACYILFNAFKRIRVHEAAANLKINTVMIHVH